MGDLDVPLFCKGCTRMIVVPWNEGDSPDTSGHPSWSFIEGRGWDCGNHTERDS